MLKKQFIILTFFITAFCQAQSPFAPVNDGPKERFRDKLFTGGNFGLQFGSITFVDISPLLGYRFTDKISAGIGATYQYYKYTSGKYSISTNVYGGRVFGRYMFTDYLFGQVEYEQLNLQAYDLPLGHRVNVESFLGGAGYMQRFGKNSAVVAMILYNFTPSVYTPYNNPVIRVGFNIGF